MAEDLFRHSIENKSGLKKCERDWRGRFAAQMCTGSPQGPDRGQVAGFKSQLSKTLSVSL